MHEIKLTFIDEDEFKTACEEIRKVLEENNQRHNEVYELKKYTNGKYTNEW